MRYERVLVTGGSGFLGRFVVAALREHCAVSVLDIKPPGDQTPYLEADILDLDAVRKALTGQQAVVHLAGVDDGNALHDKEYFETNVQGAWNVFHAAEAAGVQKLVVASSTAALGIGYEAMPDYLPIDEAHPLRTTGAYGLSKQVIETVARHFVRRGKLRILCLRPTLIVRPEREAAILAQLELDNPDTEASPDAAGADGIVPYGALSATRTYVRSRDAARCFRLALDYDAAPFDVFNVAAKDNIGREATLPRLERLWGRLPEVRDAAYFKRYRSASALDARRARDLLGWEAEGDWQVVAEPDLAT